MADDFIFYLQEGFEFIKQTNLIFSATLFSERLSNLLSFGVALKIGPVHSHAQGFLEC